MLFPTFNQAKILFFGLFAINIFIFFSDRAISCEYKNTQFNALWRDILRKFCIFAENM